MKIVLLGYMGSGKSTLGKLISEKLNVDFIDLDDYIVAKEKSTIQEIFDKKGEIYFRKIEHLYVKEVLNTKQKFVLSLGGGTPCYANNMDTINTSDVTSIYLKASISTLVNRLVKNKENRPLIATLDDNKITEFIAKHLFERRFYYEQASKTINIDKKSVDELLLQLLHLLH